jgi:hypothetical protein
MMMEIQVLAWDRHKNGRIKLINGSTTILLMMIGSSTAIQI